MSELSKVHFHSWHSYFFKVIEFICPSQKQKQIKALSRELRLAAFFEGSCPLAKNNFL